ncbi:MAG TPA: 5-(carboxyamino)imidazole ribonucleotide synthase [Thermomicrobiales bacterium]|nr:5-(carboxyamino)imidazole ribonucleotide synthase [Thermomicrobiales bacterium]
MLPSMMCTSPKPVSDVGIVGAGQLARMMMQAAIPLGIHVSVMATHEHESAAQVIPDVVLGSPDNPDDLVAFARHNRVVTFDHELVSPDALATALDAGACLRPGPDTLAYAQNKRFQRERLGALGLPVPPFAIASSAAEVEAFAADQGWPVVIKTPRGGYDGRGVWVIDNREAADDLLTKLDAERRPVLVERHVPIERELAVLVARRPTGEIAVYPVVETVQRDGICHEVIAPAPIPAPLNDTARALARQIAAEIELTGVMAVELFLHEGQITINELATRPHNSGHFSIEGSVTSQFEQHLRAVLDWPLGSTEMTAPFAVMANILGPPNGHDPRDSLAQALAVPGAHIHLYGKAARPGRKLGHVTALGPDLPTARTRAWQAVAALTGTSIEEE